MYSNVKNEKFKHFDEMIDSKIDANSNIWLNVANFRTKFFWFFDSNVEMKIHETKKHWIDSFFIDCNTLLIVAIEKIEFVDKLIVSKIISNFDTCFRDVAKKTNDFYKTNESNKQMIVDFSTISYVDLIVLIIKFELLIDFFACWLRTWLRNLFLKLKFESQRMQIIFEILILTNETFAKSIRKISIHSFNDIDFMIVCLSNQISKTKFQKQTNNNVNKFDFRYWCWHCWKYCKKFFDSLNRRSSHVKIESKISIFWNIDVNFVVFFVFNVFDLICLTFFIALILIFFRFSKYLFFVFRRFRSYIFQEIAKRIRMFVDFEHYIKNIENDVNFKFRKLIDIIDNDLKLNFQIHVVFAKSLNSLQIH